MNAIVPPLKICTKCHKSYPATPEFFHRHNRRNRSELYPQCKTCKNGYLKTPSGKAVVKRKTNKWRKSKNGKAFLAAKNVRKNEKSPEKYRARLAVHHAVAGKQMLHISECSCARCGTQAQEYHHWSYDEIFWLDVIPMCRSCHDKLHRMNKVQRAKLEDKLRSIKIAA